MFTNLDLTTSDTISVSAEMFLISPLANGRSRPESFPPSELRVGFEQMPSTIRSTAQTSCSSNNVCKSLARICDLFGNGGSPYQERFGGLHVASSLKRTAMPVRGSDCYPLTG